MITKNMSLTIPNLQTRSCSIALSSTKPTCRGQTLRAIFLFLSRKGAVSLAIKLRITVTDTRWMFGWTNIATWVWISNYTHAKQTAQLFDAVQLDVISYPCPNSGKTMWVKEHKKVILKDTSKRMPTTTKRNTTWKPTYIYMDDRKVTNSGLNQCTFWNLWTH